MQQRQISSLHLFLDTIHYLSTRLLEMTPPLIALEEHYYSKAIFESIGDTFHRVLEAVPGMIDQLREVGDGRLAAMDRGQISLQIVSHAFSRSEKLSLKPATFTFNVPGINADLGYLHREPQRRGLSSGQ